MSIWTNKLLVMILNQNASNHENTIYFGEKQKTAFIDECGNFGFDFDKDGTSLFYVVVAIVVRDESIANLEKKVETIRKENFCDSEMKSSGIGNNNRRRAKILAELIQLEFSIILLVADKKAFYRDSPISNYRDTFIKYLHQKLYDAMYVIFPKLRIIEDDYGSSEFKKGYKKYVCSKSQNLNLFSESSFEYVDSKDNLFIQVADIIAGSINKQLLDINAPNALRLFQSEIREKVDFPIKKIQFYAGKDASKKDDEAIFSLAYSCAENYIEKNKKNSDLDFRLRILFLKLLLFVVKNENANKFTQSKEILRIFYECTDKKIEKNYLYRNIVAPLRDLGVLIASCSHGYKIPTCLSDVFAYANHTITVVGPMLKRVGNCRNLILSKTDGALDIFDDFALKKYKKYFDG